MDVPANTIRPVTLVRLELDGISIVANPAKIVVIPPEGCAPTAEEISLLESVDLRSAEEGGVPVLRVPIGTE